MFQIKNSTPFDAKLMLLPDRDGIDSLFAVVKGTFAIGAKLRVADEQVPVAVADEYNGEPATSSIRTPSDISIGKPATDVLISGYAWAPQERPTWAMDVFVSVGSVSKSVRVFGDRVWEVSAAGASPSWIAPFTRMPLVWERAFGGCDETEKGLVSHRHNPVGTGFHVPNGRKPLDGLPLPNLEDPRALLSSWNEEALPVGFGAIAAHWLPRCAFAGTYDDQWQTGRAPYLPFDFDQRFCQVAPLGLVTSRHLCGGEQVEIRGLTPEGPLQFALPIVDLRISYRSDHGSEYPPVVLDTVLLDLETMRILLTWRAALQCDKRARSIRHVSIRTSGRLQ